MLDYRAIEESEQLLDFHIADAERHGDPAWAALHRLQKAVLRPYSQWYADTRDPKDRLKAICRYVATVVVEAAYNVEMATADGQPMSKVELTQFMLARVIDSAKEFSDACEGQNTEGDISVVKVPYRANPRADA